MIKVKKIPLTNPKERNLRIIRLSKSKYDKKELIRDAKKNKIRYLHKYLFTLDLINAIGGIISMIMIILEANQYVSENEYQNEIIVNGNKITATFLVISQFKLAN